MAWRSKEPGNIGYITCKIGRGGPMFNLYDAVKEWLETYWHKDDSFNTRLRLVTAVILLELVEWIKHNVEIVVTAPAIVEEENDEPEEEDN
jgi:hypothetical protein